MIEIEKKRAGKQLTKSDAKMKFSVAAQILAAGVQVIKILGWAWRWAEWWVDYDSSWEPLLEPGQREQDMTKEELRIVDSTRQSRCEDARKCRLAAFGAALRDRAYDTEDDFNRPALERALRAVLSTASLVGPLEILEIEFFVDWLARAYRSKSRLLCLGNDSNPVSDKGFCLHSKDNPAKYELGKRPLPGWHECPLGGIFEPTVSENDDFMLSNPINEKTDSRAKRTAAPNTPMKEVTKDKKQVSSSQKKKKRGRPGRPRIHPIQTNAVKTPDVSKTPVPPQKRKETPHGLNTQRVYKSRRVPSSTSLSPQGGCQTPASKDVSAWAARIVKATDEAKKVLTSLASNYPKSCQHFVVEASRRGLLIESTSPNSGQVSTYTSITKAAQGCRTSRDGVLSYLRAEKDIADGYTFQYVYDPSKAKSSPIGKPSPLNTLTTPGMSSLAQEESGNKPSKATGPNVSTILSPVSLEQLLTPNEKEMQKPQNVSTTVPAAMAGSDAVLNSEISKEETQKNIETAVMQPKKKLLETSIVADTNMNAVTAVTSLMEKLPEQDKFIVEAGAHTNVCATAVPPQEKPAKPENAVGRADGQMNLEKSNVKFEKLAEQSASLSERTKENEERTQDGLERGSKKPRDNELNVPQRKQQPESETLLPSRDLEQAEEKSSGESKRDATAPPSGDASQSNANDQVEEKVQKLQRKQTNRARSFKSLTVLQKCARSQRQMRLDPKKVGRDDSKRKRKEGTKMTKQQLQSQRKTQAKLYKKGGIVVNSVWHGYYKAKKNQTRSSAARQGVRTSSRKREEKSYAEDDDQDSDVTEESPKPKRGTKRAAKQAPARARKKHRVVKALVPKDRRRGRKRS